MSGQNCSANLTQAGQQEVNCGRRSPFCLRDELVGLFDDGQVGGKARVVDGLEAHPLEGRHDPADLHAARRHAERFAQRHANGRRDLGHDRFLRVVQRLPDLFDFQARRQGPGGANRRAETAVHALNVFEVLAEGGNDAGRRAAEGKVDHAHPLDLFAGPHAVAAQDALVRIADQRDAGIIDRLRFVGGAKPHVVDSQAARQILKLAVGALGTGRAILLVVGQDQFQGDFPQLPDLVGVRANAQAGFRQRRATGHHAAALDIDQAEPARAVDAQLRVVAEGGDFNPGLPRQFQKVPFAVDRHNHVVDR